MAGGTFDTGAAFARALMLQHTGQAQPARALYERILEAEPGHPMVPGLLGALLLGPGGDLFLARRLFQMALARFPDDTQAAPHLATVEQRLAQLKPAPSTSGQAEQLVQRAFALQERRQSPHACLAHLDHALHLRPDYFEALFGRAKVQVQLRLYGAALQDFDAALALQPDSHAAHSQRGNLLRELSRPAEAAEAYRAAIGLGGDAAALRYALAALGEEESPAAAPPSYIAELFDNYAPQFDQHLLGLLQYRGPQLIAEALAQLALPGGLQVLDLGCGTGLCGPVLKPHAARLVGVDLSSRMLERAAQRGLYDELACTDVAEFLASTEGGYDLVAAGDVLMYFGDLAPLFGALRPRLHPEAVLAFTTEAAEAGGGDFTLRPSRRYAHTPAYLRRLAAQHGLECLGLEARVLRQDEGKDIAGHLTVLRVPDAGAAQAA